MSHPARSLTWLNLVLILSLLLNLVPAPLAAQASPVPLPALEPVSYAPAAEAPARVLAQAPAVTHSDPWPPADYVSFVRRARMTS